MPADPAPAANAVPNPRAGKPPKDATVQLRMRTDTRDLIDAAAEAQGRTRTAFITDAARREAENALLDQTFFLLSPEKFDALEALLDAPPADNPKLRKLLHTPAPWAK